MLGLGFLLLLPCFVPPPTRAPPRTTLDPRWLREAEYKHARIALLALPALVALGDDSVHWLGSQPPLTQEIFFATAGVLESTVMLPRFEAGFRLKDDVVPGEFPPLGSSSSTAVRAFELVAGRAAMMAAAAVMVGQLSSSSAV